MGRTTSIARTQVLGRHCFEVRANGALDQIVKRFTKHATLVRTAVGKLQSVRLAGERGAVPHVFENEGDALAYLGVGPG
jgi:hypothetical protein